MSPLLDGIGKASLLEEASCWSKQVQNLIDAGSGTREFSNNLRNALLDFPKFLYEGEASTGGNEGGLKRNPCINPYGGMYFLLWWSHLMGVNTQMKIVIGSNVLPGLSRWQTFLLLLTTP